MSQNQKAQSKQGGDSMGGFSDYDVDKIRSVVNDNDDANYASSPNSSQFVQRDRVKNAKKPASLQQSRVN